MYQGGDPVLQTRCEDFDYLRLHYNKAYFHIIISYNYKTIWNMVVFLNYAKFPKKLLYII